MIRYYLTPFGALDYEYALDAPLRVTHGGQEWRLITERTYTEDDSKLSVALYEPNLDSDLGTPAEYHPNLTIPSAGAAINEAERILDHAFLHGG